MNLIQHQAMMPSMSCPSSCERSYQVLLKPSLVPSFTMAKKHVPFESPSRSELGHPQPPTPIRTDNSTAVGLANDTVKQKCSKAIDMQFYWVRDQVPQGQFCILWEKGILNRADYFTKHHPASHHKNIHSAYLHEPNSNGSNYIDCLQETEASSNNRKTVSFGSTSHATYNPADFATQLDCGEGVLCSGLPQMTGRPQSSMSC